MVLWVAEPLPDETDPLFPKPDDPESDDEDPESDDEELEVREGRDAPERLSLLLLGRDDPLDAPGACEARGLLELLVEPAAVAVHAWAAARCTPVAPVATTAATIVPVVHALARRSARGVLFIRLTSWVGVC